MYFLMFFMSYLFDYYQMEFKMKPDTLSSIDCTLRILLNTCPTFRNRYTALNFAMVWQFIIQN